MRHAGTNAAQLELGGESEDGAFASANPAALRAEVAEKVAAHRARRGNPGVASTATATAAAHRAPHGRRAEIAGAIAERYAKSESYRSFLATEAERSVRHAEAVADVATINARAIASAQQQLMADLDRWDIPADPRDPQVTEAMQTGLVSAAAFAAPTHPDMSASAVSPPALRRYTVRLPEEFTPPPLYSNGSVVRPHSGAPDEIDLAEASALDEEIAFRHAPVHEQEPIEALPLTANLIEFPRQLVAARRARPRLAEGPLRDDPTAAEDQLRIFEVEPAQTQAAPVLADEAPAPEWGSILLAAQPAGVWVAQEGAQAFTRSVVPQVAPLSRRLMSAMVDGTVVLATLTAAAAAFVQTAARVNPAHAALEVKPLVAALALGVSAVALGLLYQLLFFTLSGSTPGMRYARIALCTFSDQSPSRSAMRRRLLHMICGALPLGLGLFWAFLDEDTLAWHDRLSHMYQRSY